MLDELQRLRDNERLFLLLDHYAALAKEDRESWHDRYNEFEHLSGRELTKMYGELLAHGWLEQNTGVTPVLEAGRFAHCYRITAAGRRVYKTVKKEMQLVH